MTNKQDEFVLAPRTPEERRQAAIERLKAKNDFRIHVMIYLIINAMLVVIWLLTSGEPSGGRGFFWPMFPMLGWGVGVAINGYVVYRGNFYTEEQIEREMRSLPH